MVSRYLKVSKKNIPVLWSIVLSVVSIHAFFQLQKVLNKIDVPLEAKVGLIYLILFLIFSLITAVLIGIIRPVMHEQDQEILKLNAFAHIDPLTQLINRRKFIELFNNEQLRRQRISSDYCLLMYDLDDFKQINDKKGHDIGDIVLQHVSKTVFLSIRKTDILCRFGGEEFLIMLIDTDLEKAVSIADKIRIGIAGSTIIGHENLECTASFGVIEIERTSTFEDCIKLVDQQLYVSKNAGKNKVSWQR
jgi:diguanylate cyclase (GGDEF)-like protein